jgi:hypothetical protein
VPPSKLTLSEPLAVWDGDKHRTVRESTSVAGERCRLPNAHCKSTVGATLSLVTLTTVPPAAGPELGLADKTTGASW